MKSQMKKVTVYVQYVEVLQTIQRYKQHNINNFVTIIY